MSALATQYITGADQGIPALDQPQPERIPPPDKISVPSGVEIRMPTSRPTKLLLGTLNRPQFRVMEAIPVALEFRGDEVIASWPAIDEFGTGKSISQACEDLGYTVAELYASLQADEPTLGPDLLRVLGVLKQHIARR